MSRGVSLASLDPEALARVAASAEPGSLLAIATAKRRQGSLRDLEHEHQVSLFGWADLNTDTHPELSMLFAVPNFSGRRGKSTARHGARLKAEGRKSGVPDIILPVPRGDFAGLYIELKAPGRYPTPDQKRWLAALSDHGNLAVVCVGWESARDQILAYLRLPDRRRSPVDYLIQEHD